MEAFFHQYLQFSRTFTKKINEHIADLDLYQSQWSIVYYLQKNKAATLVEISNYFQVEKPTITRTVNRLEDRQLIEKVASADKRERRIQLTEKGLDVYDQASAVIDAFEKQLVEEIPKDDLEITFRTIQRLLFKINKEESV